MGISYLPLYKIDELCIVPFFTIQCILDMWVSCKLPFFSPLRSCLISDVLHLMASWQIKTCGDCIIWRHKALLLLLIWR